MFNAICVIAVFAVGQGSDAPVSEWKSDVLLESDSGFGGLAIGDLDAAAPGDEVAAVNGAGEAWLVRRVAEDWQPERIYAGKGELIMCAIGDIDPRYPGNEFVGVGMVVGEESGAGSGHAVAVHKDGGSWSAETILTEDLMLHGVAVGDVSARHNGNEVVVCGFDHRVTLLYFDEGAWHSEVVYVGNDRMKIVVVGDVLPERKGLEVLACGTDGQVVALWEGDRGWRHEVVFADPIGQSRVASHGPSVLIGGDRGKVTLAQRQDGRWTAEFLGRDTAKIRGVAVADVDTSVPGVEFYACGYSTKVRQFTVDERGLWQSKVLFTAERPLHHLVAGDIDPAHSGPELVTCGHGGRVYAIHPGTR